MGLSQAPRSLEGNSLDRVTTLLLVIVTLLISILVSPFPHTMNALGNLGCPGTSHNLGEVYLTGDCHVTESTVWGNGTLTLAGNLIVEEGSTLELWNLTLRLDPSLDHEFGVYLEDGEFLAMGGTLTSNSSYQWHFETSTLQTVVVKLSGTNVSHAGGGSFSGFRLLGGSDHSFLNLTVTSSASNQDAGHALISVNANSISSMSVENSTFKGTGRVLYVDAVPSDSEVWFRNNTITSFDESGGVEAVYARNTHVVDNTIETGGATAISVVAGGPGWPEKNLFNLSHNKLVTTGLAIKVTQSQGYDVTWNEIMGGKVSMKGDGHLFSHNNISDVDTRDYPGHIVWTSPNSTFRHNVLWNISLTWDSGFVALHYGNVSIWGNALYLNCYGPNCMAVEVINIQEEQRSVYPGFPTAEVAWNNITWMDIGVGDWAITLDNEFSRRLHLHNNTQYSTSTTEKVGNCLQGGGTLASVYENNTCHGPMVYGIYNYIYEDTEGNVFQHNWFDGVDYGGIWQVGNVDIRHNIFLDVQRAAIWICSDGGGCAGSSADPRDLRFQNNTFTFADGYLARFHSSNWEYNTVIHHGSGHATYWTEHPSSGPHHRVWGQASWLYKAQETIEELRFINTMEGTRHVHMVAGGNVYVSHYKGFGTPDDAQLTVRGAIDKRGSMNYDDSKVGTFLWSLDAYEAALDVLGTGILNFSLEGFFADQTYNVTVVDYETSSSTGSSITTNSEGAGAFEVDFGASITHKNITIESGVDDTTAPAQVTDLTTEETGLDYVVLSWTAPGDDGTQGTASEYDLRFSASGPIDEENFSQATRITTRTPSPSGTLESLNVTGLSSGTQYWFALRTADEVPNWSPVSNSPSGNTTSPDTTAPAQVTDLTIVEKGSGYAILKWTTPGDDGTEGQAAEYELRFSTEGPLNDTNFGSGFSVTPPLPGPPGSLEEFNVTGLISDTEYWFALRTADEVPNWSPVSNSPSVVTLPAEEPDSEAPAVWFLSPSDGDAVSGDVTVSLEASDNVGVQQVALWVNDTELARFTTLPYEWTWSTDGLGAGPYVLTAAAYDLVGNEGTDAITVHVLDPGDPESPRIESVVYRTSEHQIEVLFSKSMDQASVENAFVILPALAYAFLWQSPRHAIIAFQEAPVGGETYWVYIASRALDVDGRPLAHPLNFFFEVPPSPEPSSFYLNPWLWALILVAAWWIVSLAMFLRSEKRLSYLRAATVERLREFRERYGPSLNPFRDRGP